MTEIIEDYRGIVCKPLYKRFLNATIAATIIFVLFLTALGIYWISGHFLKPIDGSSMQPGINNYEIATGDIAVVNRFKTVEHGDIVIIDSRGSKDTQINDKLLIKRVIALSGDTLKMVCENGIVNIYIKYKGESEFTLLDESAYINDNSNSPGAQNKLSNFQNQNPWADWKNGFGQSTLPTIDNSGTIVIPDGYFFFMGDNRADSYDCRMTGPQPLSMITGVVETILPKDSFWNDFIEFMF